MRFATFAAIPLCGALLAGCGEDPVDAPPAPAGRAPLAATLERVVDGDTLEARTGGRLVRVRLLGIDTPELAREGTPAECFAERAAAGAATFLPRGAAIVLTPDPGQDRVDRFGRLLAYVAPRGATVSVNRRLLAAGLARVYVYGGRPFERVVEFRRAERSARQARRGLWAACPARDDPGR